MHFETHDTLIDGQRLHPEANGYAKRLLTDLQAVAFVPEWAEQTTNVEEDLGDVFRSSSKRNEWFTGLDVRQFRAAFFSQKVVPCRVELCDDVGDDDLEGENENYICTLLYEDGWECGLRWPTARALAAHQRHTQVGTHGKPKGVASLVVTNQCIWCGSTHAHNRCVVDAGRFHYPVIDIPPDTICPRCDLIFNDTADLQRHLASMEYPLPEGHESVINAEASARPSGDSLFHPVRDRWRARRAARET